MKNNISFYFIRLIIPIIFLSNFLFFTGCHDEPTLVGINNISDADLVNLSSFISDSVKKSDITNKNVRNLGSYSQMLIGKYSNTEASSLVRFSIYYLDTIITSSIKNNAIKINSAKLKLYQTYQLGDAQSSNFSFNAFEINSGWNSDTFTADSLNPAHFQYNQNNVDETFNTYSDSLIELNINKSRVLKWLEGSLDSTKEQFRGLYLKSTANTNIIKGFRALPSYTDYPVTNLEIICEYDSKIDTLTYYVNADVHVLQSNLNPLSSNNFYIQPGVEFRSYLNFNTDGLSKDFIITKAVIELQLDEQNSKIGSRSLDTLLVFRMIDSALSSYDSSKYFSIYKKDNSLYSGEITYLIQEMLNVKNNQGLLIVAKDNIGRAELLAFYGCKYSDPLKQPKLKITYAKRGK